MERYVLKLRENQFVKWIQWTAGVIPTIRTEAYEKSLIVSDDYLNYLIEPTGKTRKELIMKHYPDMELLQVKITII